MQGLYENEIKLIIVSQLSCKKQQFLVVFEVLVFLLVYYLAASNFTSSKYGAKTKRRLCEMDPVVWILFMQEFVMIVIQYLAYKEEINIYIKA